jgi:preprotein translocase subunit SecA
MVLTVNCPLSTDFHPNWRPIFGKRGRTNMLKIIRDLQRAMDFHRAPVQKNLQSYRKILEQINTIHLEHLADTALKQFVRELKSQAANGTALEDLQVNIFALIREVARRIIRQRPYDTQVLAGLAMHDGKIAEMMTGEGKTLAAVFPACLNALTGKGVHIFTFNDYLAERDALRMGPIYRFLGFTVGYITTAMETRERKAAYGCDVTYVTAKEAGFDYLRSFLCYDPDEIPQRPFHMVIVDEADSILIDEGRIPLVIAEPMQYQDRRLKRLAALVRDLQAEVDYGCDPDLRHVFLTERGITRVEQELGMDNLYKGENGELLALLNNALQAHVVLKRDVDYIVRDNRVELVDEFTGRAVANRHWPDGLQEAVEAKEGLKRQSGGKVLGSCALQHFLNAYPKIAGMAGTAQAAADELKQYYNLEVAVIPPYRPCIRADEPDLIYADYEAKLKGLVAEIVKVHASGRPILIGTGSIRESEHLAGLLDQAGIDYCLLNAKNDQVEAEIIAKAGVLGAVTISTNMAGRGTDIRLGGKDERGREQVVALGGLYVIGVNHFESSRVDNQLRGRAGRQGEPGTTRFFVSLRDELLVRFGVDGLIVVNQSGNDPLKPLSDPEIRRKLRHIQKVIEDQSDEIRKILWQYSWIVEQQRLPIHRWRRNILLGREPTGAVRDLLTERNRELGSPATAEAIESAARIILLYQIDRLWADFLEQVEEIREGIHWVQLKGRMPLAEFYRYVPLIARGLTQRMEAAGLETAREIGITPEGIALEGAGLTKPAATLTYFLHEAPFERKLRKSLRSLR